MSYADVWFHKGYGMIRSHIGSIQECRVKLEMFSHLSSRYFRYDSLIKLEALSLAFSLRGT